MLSAIETVPRIVKSVDRPVRGQFNSSFTDQSSSASAPGVMLSLGGGSSATLTYNQAGTLDSRWRVAAAQATAADETAAALATISTTTIADAISAASALENSLATAAATSPPAAANSVAPSVPETGADNARATTISDGATPVATPVTTATMAIATNASAVPASAVVQNFSVDALGQALSNITENPAYAGMAAALYLSVAGYRSPQPMVLVTPERTETPKAVNGITTARQLGAEHRENENGQASGGNRARAMRA